jgi:hypothetical protein
VPKRKLNVGTVRVVSTQYCSNERKEVQQSSRTERLANGLLAIALAKYVVSNVRMGDVRSTVSRMRILCYDAITGTSDGHPRPLEPNFERSQIHATEFKRTGGHRDPAAGHIEVESVELLAYCQEVTIQISCSCLRTRESRLRQPFAHPDQLGL